MDAELLERVQGGDRDALGEAFRRFGDDVYAVALRLTASEADAEDVLHEVFLRLPEALRRAGTPRTPVAWLRTVAARRAIDMLRVRRRHWADTACPRSAGTQPATDAVAGITLERALSGLPEKLRIVLVLKEVEGYTHAEIASLLDISESASEVRLYRAKQALRQTLRNDR